MTHPQTPFDGLSILPWILSTAFAVFEAKSISISICLLDPGMDHEILKEDVTKTPEMSYVLFCLKTNIIDRRILRVGSLSCFWIPHEHLTWRQLCWFCWLVAFFNKCQQYHGSWSFLNGPDAKRFSRYQLRSDDLMDICTVKVPRSDGYSSLQKYPKHFKGHDLKL